MEINRCFIIKGIKGYVVNAESGAEIKYQPWSYWTVEQASGIQFPTPAILYVDSYSSETTCLITASHKWIHISTEEFCVPKVKILLEYQLPLH